MPVPPLKKRGGIKSWRGSTVSVLFPCARPYNPSKPHKPQERAASELKHTCIYDERKGRGKLRAWVVFQ